MSQPPAFNRWDLDKPTHRLTDGSLVTQATSRYKFARISQNGKLHRIVQVIVRWNFHGGTREKPDVTFVLACGPQRHTLIDPMLFDPGPPWFSVCARCDNKTSR